MGTEAKINRIQYLDIAKGIGIIMVVWAHASGVMSSYITQMHMPLFFVISGLLYSDKRKPIDAILLTMTGG